MEKEMKRSLYSERTIESYCFCVEKFLSSFRKDPKKITKKDVKDFIYRLSEKKRSGSTMNIYFSAIKYLLNEIMHKNIHLNMKFSRRPKTLPVYLTKKEVRKLINSIENNIEKEMVFLISYHVT